MASAGVCDDDDSGETAWTAGVGSQAPMESASVVVFSSRGARQAVSCMSAGPRCVPVAAAC
jgi:hypothetical protein